jgi:hypothetical protein
MADNLRWNFSITSFYVNNTCNLFPNSILFSKPSSTRHHPSNLTRPLTTSWRTTYLNTQLIILKGWPLVSKIHLINLWFGAIGLLWSSCSMIMLLLRRTARVCWRLNTHSMNIWRWWRKSKHTLISLKLE